MHEPLGQHGPPSWPQTQMPAPLHTWPGSQVLFSQHRCPSIPHGTQLALAGSHTLPSAHSGVVVQHGAPGPPQSTQDPARHEPLPPMHAVPSGAVEAKQPPFASAHIPILQSASMPLQSVGMPPRQAPAVQVVPIVHSWVSSQGSPSLTTCDEQVPVARSHTPSVHAEDWALQSTMLEATHWPSTH